MAVSIEGLPQWREEKRWTVWYIWSCARPRCKKKIEATVQRFVANAAKAHELGHVNKERKGITTERLVNEVGGRKK